MITPANTSSPVFVCFETSSRVSATYYFRKLDETSARDRFSAIFDPLACAMEHPVHTSDEAKEYLTTKASCDALMLRQNISDVDIMGFVIEDDKFDYTASDKFFNTTNKYDNGAIVAKFSIEKQHLKSKFIKFEFHLTIWEKDDGWNPISRQQFSYDYPKTFNGESSDVPHGVLAMYGSKHWDDSVRREPQGSKTGMGCMVLGNPLPDVILLKGSEELTDAKDVQAGGFLRTKVDIKYIHLLYL